MKTVRLRYWNLKKSCTIYGSSKIFRWTVLKAQEELSDLQRHFFTLRSRFESIAHVENMIRAQNDAFQHSMMLF